MKNKIIALVDGSTYSESVCQHAAWMAERMSAPVEVLHVMARPAGSDSEDLSGTIRLGARTRLLEQLAALDAERARIGAQHGRAILEDSQSLLSAQGATEVTTRLRTGDIIETVHQAENEAAMIVIGKRGEHADFAKGHLGSNMERITRATTRPVLVCARSFQPVTKILLAFDGGPSIRRAVDFIAQDSGFDGISIDVVSVGSDDNMLQTEREQAVSQLNRAGIMATTRVIDGPPETALAARVDSEQFGMVVMGAYGHSRIRSLVIGSTTTAVVQACKVPILLIR